MKNENQVRPKAKSVYGACNAAYELKQSLKKKDLERAAMRLLKQSNQVGV